MVRQTCYSPPACAVQALQSRFADLEAAAASMHGDKTELEEQVTELLKAWHGYVPSAGSHRANEAACHSLPRVHASHRCKPRTLGSRPWKCPHMYGGLALRVWDVTAGEAAAAGQ